MATARFSSLIARQAVPSLYDHVALTSEEGESPCVPSEQKMRGVSTVNVVDALSGLPDGSAWVANTAGACWGAQALMAPKSRTLTAGSHRDNTAI